MGPRLARRRSSGFDAFKCGLGYWDQKLFDVGKVTFLRPLSRKMRMSDFGRKSDIRIFLERGGKKLAFQASVNFWSPLPKARSKGLKPEERRRFETLEPHGLFLLDAK